MYVTKLKTTDVLADSRPNCRLTRRPADTVGSDSSPSPSNDWQTDDVFVFAGHSEVVQLLLYSGFDPKQKDRFGQVL